MQYDTHLAYIIEKHLQNVADVTTIFQIFIKVLKEENLHFLVGREGTVNLKILGTVVGCLVQSCSFKTWFYAQRCTIVYHYSGHILILDKCLIP